MNATELSERYKREYDSLILDFQKEKIETVVNDLNASIKEGNMIETNILYNTLMIWNTRVCNLSGASLALNTQFKHLHLPSPSHYSVIFDGEEKVWKFNT